MKKITAFMRFYDRTDAEIDQAVSEILALYPNAKEHSRTEANKTTSPFGPIPIQVDFEFQTKEEMLAWSEDVRVMDIYKKYISYGEAVRREPSDLAFER